MLVSKRCGHILCKTCSDRFAKEAAACTICGAKYKPRDIIPLASDGTPYIVDFFSGELLIIDEKAPATPVRATWWQSRIRWRSIVNRYHPTLSVVDAAPRTFDSRVFGKTRVLGKKKSILRWYHLVFPPC